MTDPKPATTALKTGANLSLPVVQLPSKVPKQAYRQAQSNIPDDRHERDRLNQRCIAYVAEHRIVPPMPMSELREHAAVVRKEEGVDAIYDDYLAILVNNAANRDSLAQIPYDKRLLLMPKCLRIEDRCPAPFDEFGLLCKECGLCSIQDFGAEAERLGYAVLVAEGSAIVMAMIETGKIEAIVGVSCLNVLEKCFPHLEASAVPGVAIPLLQDDCINTTVDTDWVWDVIHLSADDMTHRLDLDAMRSEVKGWFAPSSLETIMGPSTGETERIAREWLARDGNRWRPYLATCVYTALEWEGRKDAPEVPVEFQKIAVAVECFHKASLIHDDIEDGDKRRYGQDTMHVQYGEAVAINVGDFLLGEGYRLIGECGADAPVMVEMLQLAAQGHLTLSRGQGAELCWTRDPKPLTSMDVLQIFREKTAPAFEVALRLGALFAKADKGTHDVLREYSEAVGIAYQIKDDLEDFSGESDSNDLQDLRPSLLLSIAAKKAQTDEDKALFDSLWRRQLNYADVEQRVTTYLHDKGVVAKASELNEAYREEAVRSLRFLENATLKGLLRRVVGKIFPQALIEGYCGEFEARAAAGREAGAASA